MDPHQRLDGLRMLLIYQWTARCRLVKIWVRLSVVWHGFVLGGGQKETQKSRRHEILVFPIEGLSGCNSQVYCFDQSRLDSLELLREIHQCNINHLDLLTRVSSSIYILMTICMGLYGVQ